MPNTPISGLPYPALSDNPNGPAAIQSLATALDSRVITQVANQAARDALGATGNLTVLRLDTGDYESNYGGSWSRVAGPLAQVKVWRTSGASSAPATANDYYRVDFTSSRLSGGFTFDDAGNSLTVPQSGHYQVSGRGYISGGSGYTARFRLRRERSGTTDRDLVVSGSLRKIDALDEQEYFADTLPLQADDEIYMEASLSSTAGRYYGFDEALGVQMSARYVGPLAGASPY